MNKYLAIWLEILEAKREGLSGKQVYPIFQKYQDQLDLDFAETVTQWFHSQLDPDDMEGNQDLAGTLHDFAGDIQQFPLGSRANNLEIAIAVYQAALEVRTRRAYPEQWASTQNNLAAAYYFRIKGERAENLERAISGYESALEVHTRRAYLEQWAKTQMNLATAYCNRIKGERAENLERAISGYEAAEAALEIFTDKDYSEDWARTKNNLAAAYYFRIKGERAENLERAIYSCKSALKVYTRDAYPQDWAKTKNNLANAYLYRIKGERAENLERAISGYEAALEVYTDKDYPEYWAMTKNNLANAYLYRMEGERAENLERAISGYEAALEVYTDKDYPEYWAMTQNNLANAYQIHIKEERAENLERAISGYKAALEVYTDKDYPEYWAMTQNNLANAYCNRIEGERAENLERAISCFKAALEVRTPSSFPLNCLQTARNLGNLAYNLQNWEIAIDGYDNAIRAVEQSRDWATSPQIKQQLIADALPLYGKMVEACLHLERYDQALLTVERSKARTLIELLHNSNRLPQNASAEQLQRYEQLNREIAALQYALDDPYQPRPTDPELPGGRNFNLPNSAPATHPLRTLLEARKALLKEINDPTFNEFETVKAELPDFGQLLNPTTALIEWFLPQDPDLGAYAFLVTHQNGQTQIHPHRYSPAQRSALDEFNQTYNHDDRQNSWYEALDERLDTLAQLLDLPTLLTHRPDPCHHLILIPHLYLHLFPLHALSLPSPSGRGTRGEGQLLQDEFPEGVRYAPSCQILAYLHNRPRTRPTAPFFAIQNPTEDLDYADVEIDLIRPRFDPSTYILKHKDAHKAALEESTTRAQLHNSEIVHFACHGGFDGANPLNSALILAGDSPPNPDSRQTLTLRDGRRFDTAHQGLTAAEIYRNLKLTCRLVILSACETGRLDSRTTDEYIGLASALLYAGSGTVVDTRWCVDDFATAFLTIRFYQALRENPSIPQALKAAQTWFRRVTKAEFLQWCAESLEMSENDRGECRLLLMDYDQDLPFAQKRYWSAFGVTGLP